MVERLLSFRSRRFLLLFLVVILAFAPVMRAYGDDYEGGGGASTSFNNNFGTVWYGPTGTGGIANILYVRYGVVANTQYDAALYCCRGSNFDLSDLTPTKKSKLLSNADFYQFAQLFKVGKPEETDDWRGDANVVLAWNSARQMYDETYCYSALYTNDQKIRAQDAINRIMAETDEPTGGGGGGGSVTPPTIDGDFVTIRFDMHYSDVFETGRYFRIAGENYYYDLEHESRLGTPVSVRLKKSVYDQITEHDRYFMGVFGGADVPRLYVGYLDDDESSIKWSDGTEENEGYRRFSFRGHWHEYVITLYYGANLEANTEYDNAAPLLGNYQLDSLSFSAQSGENNSSSYIVAAIIPSDSGSGGGSGGGDEPVEPPEPWPDPPSKPVGGNPEVPGPGDPTVPTPPDPPNPWEPIPDIDITITGDDFQDLLDALNEHCIHLQTSIQDNVSQLWSLQSELIESQIEWLGNDVVIASFTDLKDYLHELFEWLADQMQFDVNVEGGQYDDTSVIYWLKQIWGKLPTGINSRPTDPVTNPTGWWDWLTQLLNNLAADLMALGHDRLAGLLEMLNQLRNKFPFSLPWDVAALLGLLVAVPECPEFDVPAYSLGSNMELTEVGTYHITLEPYENVWEGVKWIETLAFAVYLITHTGGLMDMVTKTVRPR